jgi:hypothetical protein
MAWKNENRGIFMAQRLATEYVKTCLQLSEAEMRQFIRLFEEQQVTLQVKVLENGNQEVVFQDDGGQDIVLSFEKHSGQYVCRGSCKITSTKLVNLMRKAVSQFKGSAIVNRLYTGYMMVYHYERGSVVKILEVKDQHEKLVYEYKDTLGMLEKLFRKTEVEQEIGKIQAQINQLLDLRNDLKDLGIQQHIDERLQRLTQRLFVLEA